MDVGCGEGFLEPTLAKYYRCVYAVDVEKYYTERCARLKRELGLANVVVANNRGKRLCQIVRGKASTVFCLETLEHTDPKSLLQETAEILSPHGVLVFSVPLEIGPSLLFKEIGSKLFGRHRDPLRLGELLRAALLWDVSGIERASHRGFDWRVLLREAEKLFRVREVVFEPLPFLGPLLNRGGCCGCFSKVIRKPY